MSAYQICVRCENRWPVTYQPRQWCPACRGVLLSPVAPDGSVPPSRRNFRWVARPAGGPPTTEPASPSRGRPSAETPSYREMPRWGLLDPLPDEDVEPDRAETAADLAPTLLVGTAVVFGLAALAEAVRYGVLLYNRTRLVDPLVLAVSDAAVWATQVVGPVVALAAAVASGLRLIDLRRRIYAERGLAESRSPLSILAGLVVPGLNLAMPGVFLTEIADRDPRLLRAIRTWWVLWVVNGVLVVVLLAWRQRDTLQARADGVLLTAVLAALGAVVALSTLHVLRLFDDTDLWGRPLRRHRFTHATGPASSPIAPIVPAAVREQEQARQDRDDVPDEQAGERADDEERAEAVAP
ncbi:uncharacterized protein DUF4328 [Rhodococcus rhodochrous J45]|uniref:Uncharacterized protein DUF4328 n=1 Tax=Rhodococcus rhodochrous J45 TaxID=935266 RepID=A0A562EMB1_RHORH|nr:DUF4328 domain-containing protein [Rhodococcus rhodochrous]TWH23035.1 uncharacterized protein DUF4328 [Rhodococcus rhodochrous J45]